MLQKLILSMTESKALLHNEKISIILFFAQCFLPTMNSLPNDKVWTISNDYLGKKVIQSKVGKEKNACNKQYPVLVNS